MEYRHIIAYGLLGVIAISIVLAYLYLSRKRREERDIARGKPPKKRR